MTLSRTWFYLLPLLFPVLWAEPRSLSGSHSLRYLFSFLSGPLPGVPQYSVVGFVDEVPIIGFTSDSDRAGPRAPWMENVTDEEPQFWKESREVFEAAKKTLNDSLRDLMEINKQPPGLHVLQMLQGCELREDGSVKWFERSAYNGSHHTEKINMATDIQNRGNSEEIIGCITLLKKLLKYGKESLQRRVAPRTMVSRRKTGDRAFLTGYAYGFYPRDIEVKWVHDGLEMPWESKEILPNPDGTYQVRTMVEVQEGDKLKTYEFHVNHSGLPETAIVTMEYGAERGGLQRGALVAVAVLVPVVVVVVLGLALKAKLQSRGQRSYQIPPPVENDEEGL